MKRNLMLAGLVAAVLGFYGPWITSIRGVAALTYNAIDLAEFAKFVARAGLGTLTREWFLLPIVAAAWALGLWVNSFFPARRVLRCGVTFFAACLSLVPLPPFLSGMSPVEFALWVLYRSPEDRGLFWLSAAGLMGVLTLFAFGGRVARRGRDVAFVVLALLGLLPAANQVLARAVPVISNVYGSPALTAWGFWIAMLGFVLAAASALMRDE
jgi:hypothetical protein